MMTTVIPARIGRRAGRRPGGRHSLGLLAHQVRYEQLSFWRTLIVGVGRLYGVPFPSHWLALAATLVLGRRASARWGWR